MSEKFRDFTALQALMDGESDAMGRLLEAAVHMDGFAKGADRRFAAIEARLKAVEDEQREILQRLSGLGRLVSTEAGPPDSVELPQDHHPEGAAE